MPRNISPTEKLRAVNEVLSGKLSVNATATAKAYGVHPVSLRQWLNKYETKGDTAFFKTSHNEPYSTEFKQKVVAAYLAGEGSYLELARKYKIPAKSTVISWVSKYNGHEELKASGTGGNSLMTEGRKTTFEERVEIASYCISHDHNYAETSEKFEVSYQQARNYTIKYEKGGVTALQDNRGKRKPEDTLTEVEKLRAELKLQKAKLQRAEMELSFLKKLEEIERRRG